MRARVEWRAFINEWRAGVPRWDVYDRIRRCARFGISTIDAVKMNVQWAELDRRTMRPFKDQDT
jgi:predicted P-loop ATPase/GTPase